MSVDADMPGSDETIMSVAPAETARYGRIALMIGVVGSAVLIIGGLGNPSQFFRAYLTAYLFCLDFALGSMVLLFIYHLTGGAWGYLVRRFLEGGVRTLPLLAIGFLPIAVGLHFLYPFAKPEAVAASQLLQEQRIYMNVPFFLIRAAIYFTGWLATGYFLIRWSWAEDRTGDPRFTRRLNSVAAGGAVFYGISMHFAATDWVLALQPEYHSTIAGPLLASQQLLSALALAVILLVALARRPPLASLAGPKTFNDLGNLLLTFVVLWSYMFWFEFMLIWIANMQVDVVWYGPRTSGVWQWVAVGLALFQFAVPFVLLLQRAVKQRPALLRGVAVLCLFMQLIFVHFQVLPAFGIATFGDWWMSLAAPLGLGGLWFAFFLFRMRSLPLAARHDRSGLEALRLRQSDEHEAQWEESLAHE
jgi:hypothetical protein